MKKRGHLTTETGHDDTIGAGDGSDNTVAGDGGGSHGSEDN